VQVTGTNGKTSTARIIDQLLRAEAVRTALYTSPPLLCDSERIVLDGTRISKSELAAARAAAQKAATVARVTLTAFEELTLACFIHLRDASIDVAVLEVGMGGRWDATSAANPAVAVITSVGLDHQAFLGDTIEEIAFDKSHIIKAGSSVILGESVQNPPGLADIFLKRATSFGLHPRCVTADSFTINASAPTATEFSVTTPHEHYRDLRVAGAAYQASNTATALFAAEAALGRALDPQLVRTAVTQMTFPGRFEVLREDPLLVFDGSHNPAAAALLAQQLQETAVQLGQKPVIVLGILADKDAAGIIAALAPVAAGFIVIEAPGPRALPAAQLAQLVTTITGSAPLAVVSNVPEVDILREVLKMTGKQPVVVTGSLSLYPLLQSLRPVTTNVVAA